MIVLFSFVLDPQRFDQPSFSIYANMESLLVKALRATVYGKKYANDINVRMLNAQLEIAAEGG